MKKKKKPELVVWNEETGYDARIKGYPTNIGAPKFYLPDVPVFRTQASQKMLSVFEREQKEIIERIEELYTEYKTSIEVWESKMSFEPIVGKTYYLYDLKGQKTLSLLAPSEWGKNDCFLGSFLLNSDNKWIKK
jgi:hypothetical protein